MGFTIAAREGYACLLRAINLSATRANVLALCVSSEHLERFKICAKDFDVMNKLCTCYRAHPIRFGVGAAGVGKDDSFPKQTYQSAAGQALSISLSTSAGRLASLRAALGIKCKCVLFFFFVCASFPLHV